MTTPAVSPAQAAPTVRENVLEVRDLRVHYATAEGDVIAVNGACHRAELWM